MDTPYAAFAAQAELAVAGIKDPELRQIAFGKILEDLIAGASPHVNGEANGREDVKGRQPRGHSSKPSPQVATTKPKSGPLAYVEEMIDDGFFKKPKSIAQVKIELEDRGHHIPVTSLSGPLQKLCQRKRLRRTRQGDKDSKKTFVYAIR